MLEAGSAPTQAQRYRAALKESGLRLRLPAALETEYLRYKDARSVMLLRVGCGVAVVLYAIFFGLDFATQRRLLDPWVFFLVFAVASPATLLPGLATFHPRWRNHARRLAPVTTAINGAVLILIVALQTRRGVPLPYEVLILNLMYVFFLGGILFRVAFPLAAAIVAAYLAADAAAGLSAFELADHGFILAAFAILSGIACYMLEFTERRSWLRARLVEEMAIRDDLTGMFNRRYFYEQGDLVLRQAQRDAKPIGLLLIDVDEFKRYNDSLGHVAGDDCLRKISQVLREAAQRPLDLAVRLGGEEFGLLLFDIPEETLHERAERLRANIEGLDIPHPGSHRRFVSISVGSVAARGGVTPPLDSLVALADHALYAAKAAGRNRVCVSAA